jgi:adenylate cyclase class IV
MIESRGFIQNGEVQKIGKTYSNNNITVLVNSIICRY